MSLRKLTLRLALTLTACGGDDSSSSHAGSGGTASGGTVVTTVAGASFPDPGEYQGGAAAQLDLDTTLTP